MTIRECYESVGSDFDDVLGRLGSENLIRRFAVKFLDDKTFEELENSMHTADGETAFRAAHTLKGVCLNLGFTALGKASSELTEALRGPRHTNGCEQLFANVETEYNRLFSALQALD